LIVGAFFAGVALANSDYKTEIQGKITPLTNFFSIIFFVALGMQLKWISTEFLLLLLILIGLVIIVKPLVIMFLIRILGYEKRTAFLTGNSLAQTSEFSLILAMLAFNLGHIDQGLFSTLVLLTVITMSITTYFITYEKKFYSVFGSVLNLLNNFKSKREDLKYKEIDHNKIILFGCHRMGSLFLKEFEKNKQDVLVIDYNPDIIQSLIKKKIPCIYGDVANPEVLEKANLRKAEVVISTVADVEDNLFLIKRVKKINPKTLVFVVAERISEAMSLYKAGADYVILPRVIGGQRSFEIIGEIKNGKRDVKELKKQHVRYLNSIHKILY
jgi:voltage-gated potassium channel Kch